MNNLERLQVLTEIIREFKTAILNEIEPEKTGSLILEIIQESGDAELADYVLQAYLRLSQPTTAVEYLDEATKYLHNKIDQIMN